MLEHCPMTMATNLVERKPVETQLFSGPLGRDRPWLLYVAVIVVSSASVWNLVRYEEL